MSLQATPVSGRLPDSYYMERYGCSYDEFIARLAADRAYAEYADPVKAQLTRSVGVLYDEDYHTDVLVEKREGHVEPESPTIRTQYHEYYSIGDTVVLMAKHRWFDNGYYCVTGYWLNVEPPADWEVTDIALLRENDVHEGHQRRIVGGNPKVAAYAKVELHDQLAGRTRLKPELQPSYTFQNDVMQMTLDVGMGAY